MICSNCGEEKPFTREFFTVSKACANGLAHTCRVCRNSYGRDWKLKNKAEISTRRRADYAARYGPIQRQREQERKRRKPLRVRAQRIRNGMLDRAKALNLPFEGRILTTTYVMRWLTEQTHCECCKKPFDLKFHLNGKSSPLAPSVDRFEPSQGYTVANIALVCWRCNNLKRDATPEELLMVANWMFLRRERGNQYPKAEATVNP